MAKSPAQDDEEEEDDDEDNLIIGSSAQDSDSPNDCTPEEKDDKVALSATAALAARLKAATKMPSKAEVA